MSHCLLPRQGPLKASAEVHKESALQASSLKRHFYHKTAQSQSHANVDLFFRAATYTTYYIH